MRTYRMLLYNLLEQINVKLQLDNAEYIVIILYNKHNKLINYYLYTYRVKIILASV